MLNIPSRSNCNIWPSAPVKTNAAVEKGNETVMQQAKTEKPVQPEAQADSGQRCWRNTATEEVKQASAEHKQHLRRLMKMPHRLFHRPIFKAMADAQRTWLQAIATTDCRRANRKRIRQFKMVIGRQCVYYSGFVGFAM